MQNGMHKKCIFLSQNAKKAYICHKKPFEMGKNRGKVHNLGKAKTVVHFAQREAKMKPRMKKSAKKFKNLQKRG